METSEPRFTRWATVGADPELLRLLPDAVADTMEELGALYGEMARRGDPLPCCPGPVTLHHSDGRVECLADDCPGVDDRVHLPESFHVVHPAHEDCLEWCLREAGVWVVGD